jgi:two-component system, cell cycle response regulator
VLDLDRLKSLNDRHGHLTGAEAVRTVGRIIAEHTPAGTVACRYGGDEFVIALPRTAAPEGRRLAEALRETVRECSPVLAGVPFPRRTLSISIGVACRTFEATPLVAESAADFAEAEALFGAADAALYVAKNAGRNAVHVA